MVYVQQVTVEIEVCVAAGLDSGVGGLISISARRKGELRKDAKRRNSDARVALGGVGGLVDDDFLDLWVRGLRPVRSDGRHGDVVDLLFGKVRDEDGEDVSDNWMAVW